MYLKVYLNVPYKLVSFKIAFYSQYMVTVLRVLMAISCVDTSPWSLAGRGIRTRTRATPPLS